MHARTESSHITKQVTWARARKPSAARTTSRDKDGSDST